MHSDENSPLSNGEEIEQSGTFLNNNKLDKNESLKHSVQIRMKNSSTPDILAQTMREQIFRGGNLRQVGVETLEESHSTRLKSFEEENNCLNNEEINGISSRQTKNRSLLMSRNSKHEISANESPSYANTQNSANMRRNLLRSPLQQFEDMNMKYAELTHRQLTRSLDNIHRQSIDDVSRNQSVTNYMLDNVENESSTAAAAVSTCQESYPEFSPQHVQNSVPSIEQSRLPSHRQNDACYYPSEPKKLTSALQVKDELLQEKEAMILKLRLHVSSLQHQMRESEATLRQLGKPSPKPQSKMGALTSASYIRLQEKKVHDLEQLLGKTENKLFELTSQYKKEKKELGKTISKLENVVKTKEKNFNDLKKQYKASVDLTDKQKRRVERLEQYLGDLPTLEETNSLKFEAQLLGKERETLVIEMSDYKNKIELKRKSIIEKEMEILTLKKDIEKKRKAIEILQERLTKVEKSKEALGPLERDELEDLRIAIAHLKEEKKDAALMLKTLERRLKLNQERHKTELEKMQEKIEDSENITASVRKELQAKQLFSSKLNSSMKTLAAQNQQLLDEKLTLQEKIKNLETINENMEETAKLFSKLQRETNSAAQDLRALTQVLLQTANGADPNISALLGVRSDSSGWELELNEDSGSNPADDTYFSPDSANKRLYEIRQLRKDIDQLRSTLTEHYASSLGNNCITQ